MKLLTNFIGKIISGIVIDNLSRYDIQVTPPSQAPLNISKESIHKSETLAIHDWRFFWKVAIGHDLGFADSYLNGHWDHHDLPSLFKHMAKYDNKTQSILSANMAPLKLLSRLVQTIRSTNTIPFAKKNIRAHYDFSNEFFNSFLDPSMTYSCALFDEDTTTLHHAQQAKINTLLNKGPVIENDSILDIGCGWGSLSITAAKEYCASVTAVTLAKNQYLYTLDRIRELGLEEKISVFLEDYRKIQGDFDHIFAVEMLEAVGHKGIITFFEKCESLLRPNGTLQLQVITIPDERYDSYRKNCDFIQKYIFPGGQLLSIEYLRKTAESRGFYIEDDISIGQHYVKTLAHWRKNLDRSWKDLKKSGFENFDYRRFIYYLSYCEAAFEIGRIDDHQITLKKI